MRKSPALILTMLSAVFLSACGTTAPTSFYTLSPQSPLTERSITQTDKLVIDIGPVEIAPYLDRNQIVTRSSPTRLRLNDIDHWAAPLDDTIANVLAVNLARLLPETQPIVRPWADIRVQYKLFIKVLQFDSDTNGKIQFKANWAIQTGTEQSLHSLRYTNIEQTSIGNSYEAITQNMSSVLATFSEQIAAELKQRMQ